MGMRPFTLEVAAVGTDLPFALDLAADVARHCIEGDLITFAGCDDLHIGRAAGTDNAVAILFETHDQATVLFFIKDPVGIGGDF